MIRSSLLGPKGPHLRREFWVKKDDDYWWVATLKEVLWQAMSEDEQQTFQTALEKK